jgi:16S rRNA (uracil1498-N3)-methyltransferase
MNRFYVLPDSINENSITITGPDVNHIKNVLRLRSNDELVCFDGKGMEYLCSITEIGKDLIKVKVLSSKKIDTEPSVNITLVQALPTSSKMDFIIQKAVELGVHNIIPIISERTIAKGSKLDRWRNISKESSEQCGRGIIPEVSPVLNFHEFLNISTYFDLKLIPWENEKNLLLKSLLKDSANPKSIALLIGPEGGFSAKEVEAAVKNGFKSVSLGKRILRTETAGMAAIAMIMYEMEM